MPILKIEKLTKKYGKTYALNGLDMEVKKGDIYGFVGPNAYCLEPSMTRQPASGVS